MELIPAGAVCQISSKIPVYDISSVKKYEKAYKWTLSIDDKFNHTWNRDIALVHIEKAPFAKGLLRTCFKMTDAVNPGVTYVAKFGAANRISRNMYFNTAIVQAVSQKCAELFNKEASVPLKFHPIFVLELVERNHLNNVCVAELWIEGDFKKENISSSPDDEEFKNTQAFGHYVIAKSNNEVVVSGLQRISKVYVNSDIHTKSGKGFFDKNSGLPALQKFAEGHVCNNFCKALKLETLNLEKVGELAPASPAIERKQVHISNSLIAAAAEKTSEKASFSQKSKYLQSIASPSADVTSSEDSTGASTTAAVKTRPELPRTPPLKTSAPKYYYPSKPAATPAPATSPPAQQNGTSPPPTPSPTPSQTSPPSQNITSTTPTVPVAPAGQLIKSSSETKLDPVPSPKSDSPQSTTSKSPIFVRAASFTGSSAPKPFKPPAPAPLSPQLQKSLSQPHSQSPSAPSPQATSPPPTTPTPAPQPTQQPAPQTTQLPTQTTQNAAQPVQPPAPSPQPPAQPAQPPPQVAPVQPHQPAEPPRPSYEENQPEEPDIIPVKYEEISITADEPDEFDGYGFDDPGFDVGEDDGDDVDDDEYIDWEYVYEEFEIKPLPLPSKTPIKSILKTSPSPNRSRRVKWLDLAEFDKNLAVPLSPAVKSETPLLQQAQVKPAMEAQANNSTNGMGINFHSFKVSEVKGSQIECICGDDYNFYSGSNEGHISIWDSNAMKVSSTFRAHNKAVKSIVLHNSTLFTGSADASINSWDITTKKSINKASSKSDIHALCISETHNVLFSAENDKTVKVWDAHSLQPVKTLTGHTRAVKALFVFGNYLYSGSNDQQVFIWSLNTHKIVKSLVGHEGWIRAIHALGTTLYTGSQDETVRLWDLNTTECFQTIQAKGPVQALLPTSQALFSATGDHIQVWDASNGGYDYTTDLNNRSPVLCMWRKNSQLLCGSITNSLKIWSWDSF